MQKSYYQNVRVTSLRARVETYSWRLAAGVIEVSIVECADHVPEEGSTERVGDGGSGADLIRSWVRWLSLELAAGGSGAAKVGRVEGLGRRNEEVLLGHGEILSRELQNELKCRIAGHDQVL